jgi:hypothetical protein
VYFRLCLQRQEFSKHAGCRQTDELFNRSVRPIAASNLANPCVRLYLPLLSVFLEMRTLLFASEYAFVLLIAGCHEFQIFTVLLRQWKAGRFLAYPGTCRRLWITAGASLALTES